VVLAVIKGEQTITALSQEFDVRPNRITQWKNQLLEQAATVFELGAGKEPAVDLTSLRAKIGELTLEKKAGSPRRDC
jgi:transposase